MKLLEKIKTKLLAVIMAVWSWLNLKAMGDRVHALWTRMGQKWRNT